MLTYWATSEVLYWEGFQSSIKRDATENSQHSGENTKTQFVTACPEESPWEGINIVHINEEQ
jgi:hypothetical protein